MKKRKIYEISIIDKTYSKTISDETKFYTSDTALELVFELKETEYTFESAEIVLLNIDDRSLVTRPVAKDLDGLSYELGEDIIAHYGEWRGQLRFEQAGEIYVSSPVKFRIENNLSNERPPQLSDVQSWVSLKRYADSLIDELKQAVLSIEGVEDTFNANELDRKSQFETAEQSRQTTFETNESERDETFSANEDIRQTQELEREEAESQRQTVFDGNEANRTETFNTNEATRKENETARQQAETQRATAESSRASAEAQRKIDHDDRSAELAGKADKVDLKNEIENGNFSKGTTGWYTYGSTIAVEDNKRLKVSNNGSFSYAQVIGYLDLEPQNKYYFRTKIEDGNKDTNVRILGWFNGGVKSSEGLYELVKENTSEEIINRELKFYDSSTEGDYYYISNIQLINLTATFGAGNEPTREEMGELINLTGYIDGGYALNNKEMLIWTLELIRRNRNAIIALGGTI